jgi:hypothetical protein
MHMRASVARPPLPSPHPRAAVLTTSPATERHFPSESRLLHLACSMVAGVACATTVAPVDLVKSRYMWAQGGAV